MLKLRRDRGLDRNPLAGSGAGERDALGVQEVAVERSCRCAVKRIADYRVTDAGEMYSDLVRSARSDADFEQSEPLKALQYLVFAESGAATSEFRGHSNAAERIASDGSLDAAAIGFQAAMYESQINLVDRAAGELFGEVAMSRVGARHQDHAAGESIEPMHDAWTQRTAHARERPETMNQGVH